MNNAAIIIILLLAMWLERTSKLLCCGLIHIS